MGISKMLAQADTLSIEVKPFAEEKMEELRNDSELIYPIIEEQDEGIMASFFRMLGRLWKALTSPFSNVSNNVVNNGIYFLAAVLLVYLIYRILGSEKFGMFQGKREKSETDYQIEEENIHEIDFDQDIERALKSKQYRMAIRLLYLKTLKFLTDQELIQWEEGKTNHDYFYEIKDKETRRLFEMMSNHFNYVWYGHFEADVDRYNEALEEYISIEKQQRD